LYVCERKSRQDICPRSKLSRVAFLGIVEYTWMRRHKNKKGKAKNTPRLCLFVLKRDECQDGRILILSIAPL